MGSIVDISEVLLELGLSASVTDEERALAGTAIVRAEGAIRRFLKYDPVQLERTEFYPQTNFDYTGRFGLWEVEGTQAVVRRVAEASTNELQIKNIPIRSISALYIDYDGRAGTRSGSFGSETEKTEGTDFWPNYDQVDSDGNSVCLDGILRSAGAWPTSPGSVKIVYTAGYSASELHGQDTVIDASPILEAVIDEAVRRTKKAFITMKQTGSGWTAGPITSESLGDYSYSVDSTALNRLFGSTWDLSAETVSKLSSFTNMGSGLAM